jgi:hypothetical protein
LSIELIIKPQALDKTFCYKCNVTKREAGRAGWGGFQDFPQKKVLKTSKKEKKSLKS